MKSKALSVAKTICMKSSIVLLILFLNPVLFTAPSPAQTRFYLPAELGDGIVFTDGEDPYTASFRLHPMFGFGDESKFRIGISVAVVYTNPDFLLFSGGRFSFQIIKIKKKSLGPGLPALRFGTIHIAAESLYHSKDDIRVGGAVILNMADERFQIASHLTYDFNYDNVILEFSLGTDISKF